MTVCDKTELDSKLNSVALKVDLRDLAQICQYKNHIVFYNHWHRIRPDGRTVKYKRKTKKLSLNQYAKRLKGKI